MHVIIRLWVWRGFTNRRFGLDALKQRITLKFAFDIRRKIETRELPQLDRLEQLWRQHQCLRLANFQALGESHPDLANWSDSCFRLYQLRMGRGYSKRRAKSAQGVCIVKAETPHRDRVGARRDC